MPVPLGKYLSPGGIQRIRRFVESRQEAVKLLEPGVGQGLAAQAEQPNELGRLAGAFAPPVPLAPGQYGPAYPGRLQAGPEALGRFGEAFQTPAEREFARRMFMLSQMKGAPPLEEIAMGARLAQTRAQLEGREFAPETTGAEMFQRLQPTAPTDVIEALEIERRTIQPYTRPFFRRAGEELVESAIGLPGGRALRMMGVDVPLAPGRKQVGAVTEAVGAELALPSNFVYIPVLDPAVARLLGLGFKLATRAGRAELRTGLRVTLSQADDVLRRATRLLARGDKRVPETFVRDLEQTLAEPRFAPQAAGPAPAPVPEAVGPRAAAPGPAEAAPAPPAREPTVRQVDLEGREIDTFATEAERAGIRETQAGLPMGAGEQPIETAGPLFAQQPRGPFGNVLRDIQAERELAQDMLADSATKRVKGQTAELRQRLAALDEEERIVRGWQKRRLSPEQQRAELGALEQQLAEQQLRGEARREGRGWQPAYGTAEAAEAEFARRGRAPGWVRRQREGLPVGRQQIAAQGEAVDRLSTRLGLDDFEAASSIDIEDAIPRGVADPDAPPVTRSTRLGGASELYAAPLREFDQVVGEVVASDNPVVRALVGKIRVNPSVLENTPVGRAIVAYWRQRVALEEMTDLAVSAALDVHAQRFTGLRPNIVIPQIGRRKGLIRNVKPKREGTSLTWQDAYSRPDDYLWKPQQRAEIDDFHRVVDEVEFLRVQAGLPARATKGPKAVEEGWLYTPRQVKGIRGVELQRPSNPKLQRLYEEAAEGRARGIDYDTDPRATLELHVRRAYQEIADKQFSDHIELLNAQRMAEGRGFLFVTPRQLVHAGVAAATEKAGKRMAAGQNAILALQRARRGEQIPAGTIKSIEDVFPELRGRVRDATEITLADLKAVGERATTTGVVTYKPTSAGTLKKLASEVAELEAAVEAGAKRAEAALRRKRAQWGFAKYRFAQEQEIRGLEGWSYGDHLENPGSWLQMERSTKTILRENVRIGDAGEVTQKALLQGLIKDIRGEPYTIKTTTGNLATRYRGGYMEAIRQELMVVKSRYTKAMEAARRAEVAPGNLFGEAEDTIPIAQWRNRFFRREDTEKLRAGIERFFEPDKQSPWVRGPTVLANYIRFFASVGDFAEPFIQGQLVFGADPPSWARSAARHYQAFFDPSVQARIMRDYLPEFQEMAAHSTPIGDPEFFAALRAGGGVSTEGLFKLLPGGDEARHLLRLAGRQTFGRFQASYNTGLGSSRAMLTRVLKDTIPDAAMRQEAVRNMTGGLDSRALGVSPGQRAIEGFLGAFSPRFLRSTLAHIGNLRLGLRDPRGRAAWMSLSTLATTVTGLYVLSGLGLGKSWEEIRTGLNPAEGKKFLSHQVNGDWIGIGGQVRAIVHLGAHMATNPQGLVDFDQFDNPLIAFYMSRGAVGLSLLGGAAEALTGGEVDVLPFDKIENPIDFFKHVGTSALPFVVQGRLEGEQATTSAFGIAGLRVSPETPREELAQRFEEKYGYPYNRETDRLIAEQDEELRPLLYQSEQRETRETVSAEQAVQQLSTLAQGVRQGDERAGEQFRGAYSDWLKFRAGATALAFYGSEFPDPETPEGKILDEFYTIRPEDFRDEQTFQIDWFGYDMARDEKLSQMPAKWRESYKAGLRLPEELQDVEAQFKRARDVRDQLGDISPVIGLQPRQYDSIRDFLVRAKRLRQRYLDEQRQDVSLEHAIVALGQMELGDPNLVAWARRLRSGVPDELRNPRYDDFLLRNAPTLQLFYPDLYRRRAILRQLADLPAEAPSAASRQRPQVPQRPRLR